LHPDVKEPELLSEVGKDDAGKPGRRRISFRDAARVQECDDEDTRFKERVRKLVKHKPVEEDDG
jgi:hypothetical protein